MYEDKYKNIKLTGMNDLDSFLNLLADLNEPLEKEYAKRKTN